MFKSIVQLSLLLVLCHSGTTTNVSNCKPLNGEINDGSVTISACQGPPCRLRRKTEVDVTLKFKPETDVQGVTTNVFAIVVGIPLPFIGVDGTDACNKIYHEDGKTKASCPLKGGQNYVYKNSFKILEIYPKLKVTVHWSLQDVKTQKDLICFELMSRITS